MSLLNIVSGAVPIVGDAVNGLIQENQNRKNREFAREMYDRNKADTLQMWQQNNTYNSPQEQMKRLQQAGLNPNLVYGNGAVANSASAPTAPSQPHYQGVAPQINPSAAVDMYLNTQAKQAQIDNLKAQNTVIVAEGILKNLFGQDKKLQIGAKSQDDHGMNAYQWDAKKTRYDSLGSQGTASLRQQEAEILLQTGPNQIESSILDIARKRIALETDQVHKAQMQTGLDNMIKEGKLKQFEIDLNKNGMTKHDNVIMRGASQLLKHYGITLDSIGN